MYSWFIDLYVPCTGYNLYKTLPIFMQCVGVQESRWGVDFTALRGEFLAV
jgi:hypothetical protein